MSHPETVPNTASINCLELPPDAQEALSAVIPERPVVNAASLREQVALAIARQDAEGRTTIPDTFTDEAPSAPEHRPFRRWLASRPLGRLAAKAAIGFGLVGGVTAAIASPAHAETAHTYTVTGTGGEGVWLHSDPGFGDKDDLIKRMPDGTRFTADCYVNDTFVGNNPVWLHGTDGQDRGYFTDAFSDTEWSRYNTLKQQGLPMCGEQTPTSKKESAPEPPKDMITSIAYDRGAAVRWARTHAKDTPPYAASCMQFVTRALWAGGLPKDELWTDQGESGRVQKRPGSKSAWAVDHFLDYMRSKYPQSGFMRLDGNSFRNNSVHRADEGDVIIYDWEDDGTYDHATIVTDIVGNHYPEVAEWSIYDGREPTPYTERGWTYSEKSNTWLQTKSPNVVAYLLDINTTQTGQF